MRASCCCRQTRRLAGSGGSVTVHVGQNQSTVAVYCQALANSGSVQITASASGYVNGAGSVSFAPSGFFNANPGADFSTTTLAPDQVLVCVRRCRSTRRR